MHPARTASLLFAAATLLLATGCVSTRQAILDDIQETRYFTPANYTREPQLPAHLRRVLLLPVSGAAVMPPETEVALEDVFAHELQRAQRFEVVRLSREDCRRKFGAPEFSSAAALPHDFLETLGREYAADAVLFVDLTAFRAYRPLALGVRAKLATVEETRLLWSFDEVFSGDDATVSNSLKRFYTGSDSSGTPLNPAVGALQSPTKFAAYVAAATFDTLPPR
jgi:hypothetical protein